MCLHDQELNYLYQVQSTNYYLQSGTMQVLYYPLSIFTQLLNHVAQESKYLIACQAIDMV